MKNNTVLTLLASLCVLLSACGNKTGSPESELSEVPGATISETAGYQKITQEQAKEMMMYHIEEGVLWHSMRT